MKSSRISSTRRGIALLLLALMADEPIRAQQATQTVVISADEYWEIRPTTCPTFITGGLMGSVTGYWHAGYSWTDDWTRYRFPNPADVSHAEYRPESYDGHTLRGDYIKSRDGRARWFDAELYVRCTAIWRYVFGFLVGVEDRYKVLENRGEVEVCSGGGTALLDDPDGSGMGGPNAPYDPYADSSANGCDESSSGGGTGGSDYTCRDEYVYVEISYDGGVTWEVLWEGWAIVCE